MKSRHIIGSRGSRLALWQADWVKSALEAAHPGLVFTIEVITTSGDTQKNAPLAVIGGKGVFIKEIEDALLRKDIDIAVHSLKDMPTTLSDDLSISAITKREDARDALVLRADFGVEVSSLSTLPDDAVVGTSSPRRLAQLKHISPDRVVKDLRGNVDTRLRKLDAGWYDAIVLAAAGLKRLGMAERISAFLEPSEMLSAVGQGALGLETRADDADTLSIVESLNDIETEAACKSERALLRTLGGGCQLPIAGFASTDGSSLRLEGLVATLDGKSLIRDSALGLISEAERLGSDVALLLIENGADTLLNPASVQP
jgi:hydroxymethylbilane synthase